MEQPWRCRETVVPLRRLNLFNLLKTDEIEIVELFKVNLYFSKGSVFLAKFAKF